MKSCKMKMADLNARDVEHARRMVEGTARSMGLEVPRGIEDVVQRERMTRMITPSLNRLQ